MRETIITIPYNDSLPLYILILIKKRKTTCKKSLWISLQRNLNPKRFHPFDSGNEKDRNFHSNSKLARYTRTEERVEKNVRTSKKNHPRENKKRRITTISLLVSLSSA